jgi:multiple sugar transport system substrate-binding protein
MITRRILAVLLVAMLSLTLFPAAAPAHAATTTINYFTFSAAPDHVKDLDTIIAAFKQENPDIDVKVQTAPFADYFTLLQTDLSGGTGPDVFELNYENFVTYASKGTLLDISSPASADKTWDAKVYYPRALSIFQLDGKQYALPESFSTVLLFYNKDLFDAAKVDYPKADWTWDDAVAAAKKLTNKDKGVWGLYSPIQFYEFFKKAAQGGCQFFNEKKTESLLNSPECVAVLEKMLSFTKEGVMPTPADLGGVKDDELFKQGKLAMWVNGIWQFAAMKDTPFKWDITLEPGLKNKAHHFFANGIAINANTKNAAAAYKWARFLTSSKAAAQTRIASSWELPALTDKALFADYLKQTPPANRQAVFDALESIIPIPVIARQNEMQDKVGAMLDKAASGELTAQQALDQAKKDVDALLK